MLLHLAGIQALRSSMPSSRSDFTGPAFAGTVTSSLELVQFASKIRFLPRNLQGFYSLCLLQALILRAFPWTLLHIYLCPMAMMLYLASQIASQNIAASSQSVKHIMLHRSLNCSLTIGCVSLGCPKQSSVTVIHGLPRCFGRIQLVCCSVKQLCHLLITHKQMARQSAFTVQQNRCFAATATTNKIAGHTFYSSVLLH